MVNVPTTLIDLKRKVNDLDAYKLKAVPMHMENLGDVVSKEVVKNTCTTMYNKLNTKVNNLEKKIPDATTLIHINQYNVDKQSLGKK